MLSVLFASYANLSTCMTRPQRLKKRKPPPRRNRKGKVSKSGETYNCRKKDVGRLHKAWDKYEIKVKVPRACLSNTGLMGAQAENASGISLRRALSWYLEFGLDLVDNEES